MKKYFCWFLVVFIGLPLIWFLINEFEGKKPAADISLPSVFLNQSYEMSITATDKGMGLRHIRVSIMQSGKEKILLDKKYECVGYQGFFFGSQKFSDSFTIPVESWRFGMTDGEAVFRIYVSDYSWRDWNKGNKHYQEKKVIIDTKPPELEVLTRQHNISRGGSGLIIYRVFEDSIKSGVQVGDAFFPGYSGMFEDQRIFSAFFALSYLQGPGTEMSVKAEDPAGNVVKKGFYHYIRDRKYKTDGLNISDSFLKRKMPEFDLGTKEEAFSYSDNSQLKKFIYINRTIRKENVKEIFESVATTDQALLWQGAFLRLPKSAKRAGFADHRIYKYKGKEIDRQVHLGIDLASVARAPVPAANSGIVMKTGDIGIFGNTVLLDHGFGIFSLYSHLSTILVQTGERIQKKSVLGKTGATGLAGGDHLHFSIAVNGVFVNPVEWWDKSWIENNVVSKIDYVKGLLN